MMLPMPTPSTLTEPPEFVRPDYSGAGLLNLMATLAVAGGAASPYPLLAAGFGIDAAELSSARHIVLIVVDGLGDALITAESASNLAAHRAGRITSVFPSTTASSVTTLLTGLAPAQHGLTGWHMWFREIRQTVAVLPLVPRGTRIDGWNRGALPAKLFRHDALSARIGRRHTTVSPKSIIDSPFNLFHTKGSRRLAYASAAEFFPLLADAIAADGDAPTPTYTHAYLPDLDELAHEVGPGDAAVGALLGRIDTAFGLFVQRLAGLDVTVILTADHGFLTAPAEHAIDLDDHPELAAMLTRPLCGERRVAFAYVHRHRRRDFAAYVAQHFADACQLIRSSDFIDAGWFGPIEPPTPQHPELHSRAGNFVLLMRGDWTIRDWMPGERRYELRGVHGGASAAEMWVPLILARP